MYIQNKAKFKMTTLYFNSIALFTLSDFIYFSIMPEINTHRKNIRTQSLTTSECAHENECAQFSTNNEMNQQQQQEKRSGSKIVMQLFITSSSLYTVVVFFVSFATIFLFLVFHLFSIPFETKIYNGNISSIMER